MMHLHLHEYSIFHTAVAAAVYKDTRQLSIRLHACVRAFYVSVVMSRKQNAIITMFSMF